MSKKISPLAQAIATSKTLREERDAYRDVILKALNPSEALPAVTRFIGHLRELNDMADPRGSRVIDATSHPAESSILPGVTLYDRPGDRTLHHRGTLYGKQIRRLLAQLDHLVDSSEHWILGLDPPTRHLPHTQKPRCPNCHTRLGLTWAWCAQCGVELEEPVHNDMAANG